jgi:hypothetical protein
MGQQSPEESVSNAVAAAQHSVADDVVTCMSAFSGRFTTSFISHLLSHFRTDLVQSEDPDPIADMEQSVSSASERQVQSSESSSSSSLSDCSLSSMDSDENNTDVLPHTFHNAESLDPSILGTTPLKLLIETVAMKDATCVPDIDGYRLLLSKGVELQHDIKVRYTPQDIEYRPTSVSFKIGSHRVSGRKLLFYRIGKVADIDCKVFVCVGFFKEFPKNVHSAARSIHECLCKALCELDSDAPTREWSIRHGNSFGRKGKHTLNRNHCRTFLSAVVRHCRKIQFPNCGDVFAGIVFERFGQKKTSSLNGGIECRMLEDIVKIEPSVIVDGTVDVGMMFRCGQDDTPLSCFWDRNTLTAMYGKKVR